MLYTYKSMQLRTAESSGEKNAILIETREHAGSSYEPDTARVRATELAECKTLGITKPLATEQRTQRPQSATPQALGPTKIRKSPNHTPDDTASAIFVVGHGCQPWVGCPIGQQH